MPYRHGALSSGMPKATALTRRRMPLSSVTHSSGGEDVTLGTRGAALCLFRWGSSALDLRCRSSFRSSAPVGISRRVALCRRERGAKRRKGCLLLTYSLLTYLLTYSVAHTCRRCYRLQAKMGPHLAKKRFNALRTSLFFSRSDTSLPAGFTT
jgi:hypothetical protein